MGSFSIWHWLIVLAIVILVFGTKKVRNVGSDLGRAIRDFKKGLNEDDEDDAADAAKPEPQLRADQDPGVAQREAAPAESRKQDD